MERDSSAGSRSTSVATPPEHVPFESAPAPFKARPVAVAKPWTPLTANWSDDWDDGPAALTPVRPHYAPPRVVAPVQPPPISKPAFRTLPIGAAIRLQPSVEDELADFDDDLMF